MTFAEADEQFDASDYILAFESFKILSEDMSLNAKERAYALTQMGSITRLIDIADSQDDSGIIHYRKAFELDQSNVALLLNIVHSFGNEPLLLHHDEPLFEKAYSLIKNEHWDELDTKIRKQAEDLYQQHLDQKNSAQGN